MAIENFTTYTEVDPNSKIAVTSSRITFTDIAGRNVLAYVLSDKGVDFFDGSFIHYVTFNLSASSENEVISPWVMSNDIDGIFDLFTSGSRDAFRVQLTYSGGVLKLYIAELNGGSSWQSSPYTITLGTTYYLKIVRDESVGTYGTIYLYIYSDAGRTNLLATRSVALHISKMDLRYIFPLLTFDAGPGAYTATGYVENLEFIPLPSPAVSIQAMTDVVTTTATGNGNVTGLGVPAATQHGHCWATTENPTTANSKVENGVPSIGAFTSSLTGLTEGIRYYVRAYIINDNGTFYSNQVIFTAGTDYSAGAIFPADAITRVTSLTHRYDRGTYTLELNLGEVVADFGLPEWDSKPRTGISKPARPTEPVVIEEPDITPKPARPRVREDVGVSKPSIEGEGEPRISTPKPLETIEQPIPIPRHLRGTSKPRRPLTDK